MSEKERRSLPVLPEGGAEDESRRRFLQVAGGAAAAAALSACDVEGVLRRHF